MQFHMHGTTISSLIELNTDLANYIVRYYINIFF